MRVFIINKIKTGVFEAIRTESQIYQSDEPFSRCDPIL